MQKTFVLDTNVLLHCPNAINSFGADNKVVIPECVLEELDNFKKGHTELNVNARSVARYLDALRSKGSLVEGVLMENGGILKIETNQCNIELPKTWDSNKVDNKILQVCKFLQANGENVFLITKDILERIKADSMEIQTEDFESDKAPIADRQYRGRKEIYVYSNVIDKMYKSKSVKIEDIETFTENYEPIIHDFYINEFITMIAIDKPKHTFLGKVNSNNEIVALNFESQHPYGVTARNVGQKFLQEALLSDVEDVPLVIVKGVAGTAKTFFALAAGLQKVIDEQKFRKILVCRPNVMMDEEIGFLPGGEEDKIAPLMRPIYDNLEILVDSNKKDRYSNEDSLNAKVSNLFNSGMIETQAVAFLRGRSIVKQWLIIDEAQNLTPKAIKGIITRAGEGTKIVIVGDPEQIDHPFLDSRSNGLSYASEKMKGSKLCAQVTLDDIECVRSILAQEGSRLL